MPDDEELREEIVHIVAGWPLGPFAREIAEDLLPVVERYAAQQAAEALREAAEALREAARLLRPSLGPNTHTWLKQRADALDGDDA